MKKVLSLVLILLLLAGCAPAPAREDFVQLPLLTDAPAITEAPTAEAATPVPEIPADDLILLTAAPPTDTAEPAVTPAPTEAPTPTRTPKPTKTPRPTVSPTPKGTQSPVRYGEDYDDKDRVALYLHLFGELPPHFITKKQAQDLGWSGGEVEDFRQGAAIGGDRFGNYEGLLPKKKGRTYYECDIGTVGKRSRGAKRIIFSNDGLIYYTDDHYESFTLLYGEE